MISIDLNCDLGEGFPNDEKIIPYISSANIACGFHAGDDSIMKRTIECCLENNVAVGAHPGYADKINFGRKEQQLTSSEYYDLIYQQLYLFKKHADTFQAKIHHVKPHGALYNQAAKSESIASSIAKAVYDFDKSLVIYGLSGSCLINEAGHLNLTTASEVFADRTYQDDGSLTPRTHPNALILNKATSIQQVLKMLMHKTVTSINEICVFIKADTICIHGDGDHAVSFAETIYKSFKEHNIEINAI